jgi:hypothetical protein
MIGRRVVTGEEAEVWSIHLTQALPAGNPGGVIRLELNQISDWPGKRLAPDPAIPGITVASVPKTACLFCRMPVWGNHTPTAS